MRTSARRLAFLPLLASFAALAGCASSPPTPSPAPAAVESAPSEPAASQPAVVGSAATPAAILCWETEEEIILAAGGEQPGARRVVRLRFEPEAGRVLHESLRLDPNPRVPPRLFTVTWTVDGEAFTLADGEGKLSGSGTMVGEPWAWTGWTASTRLGSGIRIEERGTIAPDGTLELEREAFGPDGRAVMTLLEMGQPLTAAVCEERLSQPDAGA